MNMDDDTYDKLHDYLDGLLPEAERRSLEGRLASDGELRAEFSALRALRDDAAALPRSIAPGRDLWPDISARIAASGASADNVVSLRRPRRRAPRSAPWGLLAAAAAVLALMLSLPGLLERGGKVSAPPPGDAVAVEPEIPTDDEFKRVAAQYIEARNQLTALLAERRGDIAPETLAVVEDNLGVIASAVTEIELALAKDPQSRGLERMLYAAYRSQMELLQQAIQLADLPSASNEADDTQGDSNEEA